MNQNQQSIPSIIATHIQAQVSQVEAAIRLLDSGDSVPFIARYRKEATQGLDDVQLRHLAEKLTYLRKLDERRQVVLDSIESQGKLTETLKEAILQADSQTRLEDLYLPYRPKRRTKASLAREAGLEPLAQRLLDSPTPIDPASYAAEFIKEHGLSESTEEALEGARQILMERFAEDPDMLLEVRQYFWRHALLKSNAIISDKKNNQANAKYADYADYKEPLRKIPSHRALALLRGRRESALRLSIILPEHPHYGEQRIAARFNLRQTDSAQDIWLMDCIRLAWNTKVMPKLELELLATLREQADEEAIRVFATNLRDLLLAAPAGPQVTIGLDPGIRTGVKVTVINETGKLLDDTTLFPLPPHNDWNDSITTLAKLAAKYQAKLISIGNGTGSRETERLVSELIQRYPDLSLNKFVVSEAGASVYSASPIAAEEFPDLDVSLRGAVSIARRLQDPLPELVKIDPKSIGVGQYQHDVNQHRLSQTLDTVIEDCVNAVGVDINLASVPLLKHVSGLNETLAKNLVAYRDEHGRFRNREELKQVSRMGEKAFQQAAGFLRIHHGDNPLDASGIHPEAYPIVAQMVQDADQNINNVIGNQAAIKQIDLFRYVSDDCGMPTLQDIVRELEKPGRDPRPTFKTARFKEGVMSLEDLQIGMELEGVVSNVTNFGAFVDIGVHQDGLVHISEMTDRFIKDPHTIVKAGDILQVRVTELDKARRRISLSMKPAKTEKSAQVSPQPKVSAKPASQPTSKTSHKQHASTPPKKTSNKRPTHGIQSVFNTAMADALSKLKQGQT